MLMRRHRKNRPCVVSSHLRSRPLFKWAIAGYYVDGKRVRKFFKTKDDAQTFVRGLEITTENLGTRATQIDPRLHIMAVECNDLLTPYGRTLSEATDFYCKHLNAVQRSCTVSKLIPVFIENKQRDGAGHLYLKDLRYRLKRFGEDFGDQVIAMITNSQCNDWLKNIPYAPGSRNSFRRVLKLFFDYAVIEGYCRETPMAKTTKAKETDEPVEILEPEQLQSLLNKASSEIITFLAIGAFAGLRTAERLRLDWSEIHLERNFIEVRASKSKTARRRLVTILPNLRTWLEPHQQEQGMIVPPGLGKKMEAACKAAGISRWPHNGLRHSYASYHVAQFKDAAALALQMGHTTTDMLFDHYREVVSPQDAEKYWNIIRPLASDKIIESPALSLPALLSDPSHIKAIAAG
jgi:integrase